MGGHVVGRVPTVRAAFDPGGDSVLFVPESTRARKGEN